MAFFFTLMVTAANYALWEEGGVKNIVLCIIFIGGIFISWYSILTWLVIHLEKVIWDDVSGTWMPKAVFIVVFLMIAVINLLVLFICKYPGNLSPDSINQVDQLLTNSYSNHHPFWHTITVKAFISIGLALFHDMNKAVAVFSAFSIVLMAAIFAFSVSTVVEVKAPRWIIIILAVYFAFMPYHIMYSMTMWKDVFFGGFALLFIVFLFRCINNLKRVTFNYIGLFVSGVGICLYRSNGFFVFVFTVICFIGLWKFRQKKLLLIMACVIICSFIMKHPLLKTMNIRQPDLVESLSIPLQQVARDVIENDDFSENERNLLSEVVDVDRIPGEYLPYISDPIKHLVREKIKQDHARLNVGEYIGLYISRMRKHPSSYLKAWIDQTKGYWNGGYSYWHWSNDVMPNDLGITRTTRSETLNLLLNKYLAMFEKLPPFQLFVSIGLFDWIVLIGFFVAYLRRDKIGIMMTVPVLMNVLSLLIATPVFSEMRYNYAVFCSLPVMIAIILRPIKKETVEIDRREEAVAEY